MNNYITVKNYNGAVYVAHCKDNNIVSFIRISKNGITGDSKSREEHSLLMATLLDYHEFGGEVFMYDQYMNMFICEETMSEI